MSPLITAPPRGGSWRWNARSSLVAYPIARKLPIFTLLSPDRVAP